MMGVQATNCGDEKLQAINYMGGNRTTMGCSNQKQNGV